jgi:glucose-1-phosphate cytidylyltransferase
VSVKPRVSFHIIAIDGEGIVKSIEHITKSGARINCGFFLFRREVFQHINDGEELVEEPFRRLISEGQLLSYAQ